MVNDRLITTQKTKQYIGRFAPSPSGPLHFGSLVAALASYLDARANNGQWLLRIEDLDPPREPVGAADNIIHQLESLGLLWDGEVLFQSKRIEAYYSALTELATEGLCFRCFCSRQDVRATKNKYNGKCRANGLSARDLQYPINEYPGTSIRIRTDSKTVSFEDTILGSFRFQLSESGGDFVIRRKDGMVAYQLAVVIDDAWQGVTNVVRGVDLLSSTPKQRYLQTVLGLAQPTYTHTPIVTDTNGTKLSKQTFASAIDPAEAFPLLFRALTMLGQSPPKQRVFSRSPRSLLRWAIDHWELQSVPKLAKIAVDSA
jgi:glutamyl-Q tRNA(Asp) synthetase